MRTVLIVVSLSLAAALAHGQTRPTARPAPTTARPAAKTPAKPTAGRPATAQVNAARPDTVPDEDQVVKKVAELPLTLKGARVEGEFVVIEYTLPYSGMVELKLYDGTTKRQVFRNQYIQAIGENYIRLKASAFKPGTAYTFQLTYKGRETLGRVQV